MNVNIENIAMCSKNLKLTFHGGLRNSLLLYPHVRGASCVMRMERSTGASDTSKT